MGLSIAERLCLHGHAVSVFNRGLTPGRLPQGVERFYGDRGRREDLEQAIGSRAFDAVVDTTLYNGADTRIVLDVLRQKTGHFIFIGTGQVYLVRKGLARPFREEDYEGPVMEPPSAERESDYRNWAYGFHKREAEDLLFQAWERDRFPVTSLRAPMIHGERDHYGRILGYTRRLQDGGPVLVPEEPALPVRHVYCEDVAQAVVRCIESGLGKGRAWNLSQDETVELHEFLAMMADLLSVRLQLVRMPQARLEALDLLPACSPFSDAWMSELENARGKKELGIAYTPLPQYLETIVRHYKDHPQQMPEGYKTRELELSLAAGGKTPA